MNKSIIILSLLPILITYLISFFNFKKLELETLNYIVPTIIYSSLLFILFSSPNINSLSIPFLTINGNNINLIFDYIDKNLLMSKVVLIISTLVLIYSSKFIEGEERRSHSRYFLFLSIFISSMFMFTISSDLFSNFIFWELLGLSSYFLIGFWNKDSEAIKSSTIAFWITRFGDLFFLAGIILIFTTAGTLDINNLNQIASNSDLDIKFPLLFIVIGIFSKSAQFPFNIWLPKAMKGPTPVSSLIHSATMVVAGVLLLFKIYPLISNSIGLLNLLTTIGIISSFIGAIAAFYEEDLKKILAYSTISHIGLMFLAIGISKPDLAYFHMFSHSFFKSLLFLFAGVVIMLNGTSKLKNLDSSIKLKSPMGAILVIACCSLSSIYFFTGSFSKEYIIFSMINDALYIESLIILFGVVFTSLYSAKILFTLIDFNLKNEPLDKIDLKFIVPLLILAILSLSGPLTMSIFNKSIEITKTPHSILWILALQILTFVTFYIYLKTKDIINEKLYNFRSLSDSLFGTDNIYLEIYDKVFKSTSIFIAWFDRNILDGLINFIPFRIIYTSKKLMGLQNGQAKLYAVRSIIFFILLILLIIVTSDELIIGALK